MNGCCFVDSHPIKNERRLSSENQYSYSTGTVREECFLIKIVMSLLFTGEVGFLAEHRRINVAITRARRHLTVVGDSETVSRDGFLKSLIDYMSSQGEVRSAHEYIQQSVPTADGSPYDFENHEVLLTEITKDLKKRKKGLEGKKTEAKKGSQENHVNKSQNEEVENGAAESDKVMRLDPPCSTCPSAISSESSALKDSNNSNDLPEVHQTFPSNVTVAGRHSRETLEKQIMGFIQDASKLELPFPRTLNSQQRFDVHSIAEKLGLSHESKGEGKDRYIVVSKPNPIPKGLLLRFFPFTLARTLLKGVTTCTFGSSRDFPRN